MGRLAGWMWGLLAVLLVSSCAPSLRMVHRSRAYFERCYAADFDPRIRRTERHACWVAWLDHYTGGQPRERIAYARARVASQGADADSLRMPGVDDGDTESSFARAAHAPPPSTPAPSPTATVSTPAPENTARSGDVVVSENATVSGDATEAPPAPRAVRAPAGSSAPVPPRGGSPACAPVCDPRFVACAELCVPDNLAACRQACTAEYRACGAACL